MSTKKLTYTLLLMLCSAIVAMGQERMVYMGDSLQSVPYSEFVNANIVIIDIQTVNGEMPTCDYIYPPTDEDGNSLGWGKSIANATKVPGRMKIIQGTNTIFDSGEYSQGRSGMTMRIRGNSSAYAYAKPYKIDLQEKADLLMRNNPSYRDKDWLLIKDVGFNWMMGLEVSRLLGMDFVPGYRYATLILNDTYYGIYMITESVKRNTNCRINVAKSGFIFEYDAYWWTEDVYIESSFYPTMKYTIKYPDPTTDNDLQFLAGRISDYENSIGDGTYESQIDVTSFARWILGLDILGIFDSAGSNMFLSIYDHDAKIKIPTMWDFDSSKKRETLWSRTHTNTMNRFFKSSNKAFTRAFVTEWERLSPIINSRLNTVMNKFGNSSEGDALQRAYDYHKLIWPTHGSVRTCIIKNLDWISKRKKWIDKNIQAYYTRGDVNRDWIVDIEDVNAVINMILGNSEQNATSADLNKDNIIDVEDVNLLINIILNSQ